MKYHTKGNIQATMMKAIIDKNAKTIISECQEYLDNYADGKRPQYATDIDYLIKQLSQ